jgi:hypothetical protein
MALQSPVPGSEDQQAETPLSGVRAEFRTALRAEIEAAKRAAATSAIPLVGGRKIGRLADTFQYVFGASAKSVINVPAGHPGELVIGGPAPVEAVVVSVEGQDVTLSVSQDLGNRVPRAALRIDVVFLLHRLIARIEQTCRKPNPAGDRLLGEVPASGAPEVIDDPLLDDTQAAALASSLGRDITFIWGTPGTGKTQTVGSIGAQLYRRNRSLLLVSNTNAAVDQGLVEIADRLGGHLGAGALLRLGIPSDHRLRKREDLLLDAVVRKREEELRSRQARLRAKELAEHKRIAESQRLIGVAAWAAETAELADFLWRLHALHASERSARHLAEDVARRAKGEAELLALLAEARDAAESATEAQRLRAELRQLAHELDAARERAGVAEAAVIQARWDYEKALELGPLLARERVLPPLNGQRRAVEALAVREAKAESEVDATRETLREAEEIYATARNAGAIQRGFRGFMLHIRFRQLVARRRALLAGSQAGLDAISERLGRARAVLAELEELDDQLARWRKLGSPATQEAQLKRREAERGLALARQMELEERRAMLERQVAGAAEAVKHFRKLHAAHPRGIIARLEPRLAELRYMRENLRETEQRTDDLRKALDADLSPSLAAIEALGLGHSTSLENAEERFVEVAWAKFEAGRLAAEIDVAALNSEVMAAQRQLGAIEEPLARVEQELQAVRQTVIADAMVIGTTLTRVYLWDEIQDRRFDTVILDEASLAPIPALWTVACLADANVVVIGDVRQLPPTNQAEHPLVETWLSRDVFDVSRVRSGLDCGIPPPHFIHLNEQCG